MTPLEVRVRDDRDELVVTPCGEVDLTTAHELEAALHAVAERASARLILDLSAVTFVGAAGVNLIARVTGELLAAGKVLVIRSPGPFVQRMLQVTGYDALVEATAAPLSVPVLGANLTAAADNGRASRHPSPAPGTSLPFVIALEAALAGAAGVSLTLQRDGELETVAASEDLALRLDREQFALAEGPCVHAARTGEQAHVAPGSGVHRWPRFLGVASAAGVGSILSTPLTTPSGPIGALNVYRKVEAAFDAQQQRLAHLVAQHAARALAGPKPVSEGIDGG